MRLVKEMYNGFLCSLHFFCDCLSEKIMLRVDLSVLKHTAAPDGMQFVKYAQDRYAQPFTTVSHIAFIL